MKKGEDNVNEKNSGIPKGTIIPSPFSLTNIKDLPDRLNVDSVTLKSIIRDPMISELWEFNYMHDLNFIMENMDPDTRDSTKINIVHGYWRREDGLYMKASSRQAHSVWCLQLIAGTGGSTKVSEYQSSLRIYARDVRHA